MADDTREAAAAPSSIATPADPASTLRKLPKGVILGKDGKPCRSCTLFPEWAAQTKKSLRSSSSLSSPTTVTSTSTSLSSPPTDCPPDVETLGHSSWTLLHSISASYPARPSVLDKSNVTTFLRLFGKLYPCWVCAEDFQDYMRREQVRVESRDELGKWMCEAHNEVNRKLGKEEFDCSKWEERWRTGWRDGRCD